MSYDADARELQVDRRSSGEPIARDGFHTVHRFAMRPQEVVAMRILVDRASVEVFADEGRAVISDLIFPAPSSQGLALIEAPGGGRRARLAQSVRSPSGSISPLRRP